MARQRGMPRSVNRPPIHEYPQLVNRAENTAGRLGMGAGRVEAETLVNIVVCELLSLKSSEATSWIDRKRQLLSYTASDFGEIK